MLTDCQAVAMLPVSDLRRARAFYTDTLGMKLLDEYETEFSLECADGTSFGVFLSQGSTSGDHTQLAFMCEDIEAEVADLHSRGIEIEEVDMPGGDGDDRIYEVDGQRAAWFRDPEGNLLGVVHVPSAA